MIEVWQVLFCDGPWAGEVKPISATMTGIEMPNGETYRIHKFYAKHDERTYTGAVAVIGSTDDVDRVICANHVREYPIKPALEFAK
ncbi:MAG TPA: hypothetical protein VMX74_13665 [Pirellulales bacterium]|nr:hypothetical protein [Pirellulales bacterium]